MRFHEIMISTFVKATDIVFFPERQLLCCEQQQSGNQQLHVFWQAWTMHVRRGQLWWQRTLNPNQRASSKDSWKQQTVADSDQGTVSRCLPFTGLPVDRKTISHTWLGTDRHRQPYRWNQAHDYQEGNIITLSPHQFYSNFNALQLMPLQTILLIILISN